MSKQIVVFHQHGCPACTQYVPRFKRIGVKYRALINIQLANLSKADKKMIDAATRYKINAVPTTLVLDGERVVRRVEGSVDDSEIRALFEAVAK